MTGDRRIEPCRRGAPNDLRQSSEESNEPRGLSTPSRSGHWMQTFSGRRYWPWNPHPKDVYIEDIAHALSLQCRFAGHPQEFYSVAQHSILVSQTVPPQHALWGLMHDAAEAYVGDLILPVKTGVHEYRRLENLNLNVIARHFGLSMPIPPDVKRADVIVLATEARDVMSGQCHDWGIQHLPLDERIELMGPMDAEMAFLDRFIELKSRVSLDRASATEEAVLQ